MQDSIKLRHLIPATLLGLGLRFFFIFKYPFSAGDSDLYQELGQNIHDSLEYVLYLNDSTVPAANRMPGYPFFLALVQWIIGVGNERLFVVQAGIDVLCCLAIAHLAAKLNPRAATIALWMAMLCPFTANYTATPLTETLTIALTTIALLFLVDQRWFLGTLVVGVCTYVRPESPVIAAAAGLALAWRSRRDILGKAFLPLTRVAVTMAATLFLCLAPWGCRNWIETGSFVMIANPDAALPWEHLQTGYADWTRTWLVSSKETYAFAFKFEDEALDVNDLPARSYDSPQEKQYTDELLQKYNETKSVSGPLNWEFEKLARERAARHPWRQHVTVPFLRAVHTWFTPRIQLIPFSGEFWPVRAAWNEDPIDFSVTVGFFTLNVIYFTLGMWGAWRYRSAFPVAVMMMLIVVRTVVFTEHGTIEPRYMLPCYPALIAMGAAALARRDPPAADAPANPAQS